MYFVKNFIQRKTQKKLVIAAKFNEVIQRHMLCKKHAKNKSQILKNVLKKKKKFFLKLGSGHLSE